MSQCVVDDVLGPGVLDAIDLDHDPVVLPAEVEVVGALGCLHQRLRVGFGEAALATASFDVELTQRADTTRQLEDDSVELLAPSVVADPQGLDTELVGRDESLLDRHREHQGRLLRRPRPQEGPDCRDRRPGAGHDGGRVDVVGTPAPGLADVARRAPVPDPCPSRHAHPDGAHVVALQPGDEQRRLAVEHRPRSSFDQSHPVLGIRAEGPGEHGQGMATAPPPAAGAHIGPDLRAGDARGVEHGS